MAKFGHVLSVVFLGFWLLMTVGVISPPMPDLVAGMSLLGLAGAARANARLDQR